MSLAAQIYRYPEKIEKELQSIQGELRREDAEVLVKYHRRRVADGISPARILKCLNTLKLISRITKKPFNELTKDDIVELVANIEQRDVSAWTKRDYKMVFKKFFQWLKGCDSGEHPPEVKWIREGKKPANKLQKKDLLTAEEITSIAQAAHNMRDRAFILVFAESKRRLGEIMGLQIKDIEFDKLGARLRVDGKVGQDTARVISSASLLANWLNLHPLRDNPEAPVWVTLDRRDNYRVMSYDTIRTMLRECAERAGIKKRFFPYLTRHSVLTPASKVLPYSLLCAVAGWRQGSRMPAVYIKLAGEDIDDAHRMLNGIEAKKEEQQLTHKECIKCHSMSSADSKFCNNCGLPLDNTTVMQMDRARSKIDELLNRLTEDPEKLEKLLALIEK
ncbi:MAG: tyrosine-type recombinase/integrase [Thaumarchaeota archaeon]|nr:tyrosine-type recombinase/integrase [Nitrososphaerota archaeon]